MSSQWVNKFAIMRDLSLAQGCLPVDVAGTVGAGEKPPSTSLHFKEDTEEEFYRQWVGGDGDFAAPDLGLIKDMLEMVRIHDSPTNENEDSENIIQIKKLNPLCQEFKPRAQNSEKAINPDSNIPVIKKKKKSRNVAIKSLLQNIEEVATTDNNQSFKLLKSTDFRSKPKIELETAEKVLGWIQAQAQLQPVKNSPSPRKNNAPMLEINPMSMFKRKNTIEPVAKPSQVVKKTSPYNCKKYVPSKTAEEYYKKFVECSEMHRMVEENVWTKVERQMKEIDERRKAEAELFSLSLALCREPAAGAGAGEAGAGAASSATDDQKELNPALQKLDLVLLPQHRHQMSSPCFVCAHQSGRHQQSGTHSNSTNSPDKRDDVDDPWWNWREPEQDGKPVDHNWRNKPTDNETVDENINNVKEMHSWRTDNRDAFEFLRSLKRTTPTDTANANNEIESIAVAENGNIESLKVQTNTVDNSWKEEFETWRSPLDDEDEIDAWRYEILDIDDNDLENNTKSGDFEILDDDNDDHETVNTTETGDDKEQHLEDESSWQNEDHVKDLCNSLEKWRSVLLVNNENDTKNETDDVPIKTAFQTRISKLKDSKKLVFDRHRLLENMETLSDSE